MPGCGYIDPAAMADGGMGCACELRGHEMAAIGGLAGPKNKKQKALQKKNAQIKKKNQLLAKKVQQLNKIKNKNLKLRADLHAAQAEAGAMSYVQNAASMYDPYAGVDPYQDAYGYADPYGYTAPDPYGFADQLFTFDDFSPSSQLVTFDDDYYGVADPSLEFWNPNGIEGLDGFFSDIWDDIKPAVTAAAGFVPVVGPMVSGYMQQREAAKAQEVVAKLQADAQAAVAREQAAAAKAAAKAAKQAEKKALKLAQNNARAEGRSTLSMPVMLAMAGGAAALLMVAMKR